jgi:hypothetical protein
MGGMQTCYWRQGELKRIIPGPHHKDNAYMTSWLIHYFHTNPEPIFHFNDDLDFFMCILSGSDFQSDTDSDPTFLTLEVEQINIKNTIYTI